MVRYRELRRRIERDKARKEARRAARRAGHDDMDRAATPRHFIRAARQCRKGVGFKLSVQKYRAKPFRMMETDCRDMLEGRTPTIDAGRKITIRERGKERTITPIRIRDRINQRVLCDHALGPMIMPRLIYDNGASVKGKGVRFTRERLNRMIEGAKREWGNDFWILTFDIRKFFDSIPHELCREELEKTFRDRRITEVAMGYVTGYDEQAREAGRGVCLGSHVSQIMALCVPNFLDHWIKDEKGIRYYIRHMDDGIILHGDREYLEHIAERIREKCREKGLELNWKKTRIQRARDGFCFLKTRYRIDGMKTVKRLTKASVIRMRRKIRRFGRKIRAGEMTMKMAEDSLQSWEAHTRKASAFRQRKRMRQAWRQEFGRAPGR